MLLYPQFEFSSFKGMMMIYTSMKAGIDVANAAKMLNIDSCCYHCLEAMWL